MNNNNISQETPRSRGRSKSRKPKLPKEAKKEVKAVKTLLRAERRNGGTRAKVIKKPKDVLGSVKKYGTPYNALNSQMDKFSPTQVQAALLAWSHTVANPYTPMPHPVPVSATPGASAAVAFVYGATLYGTATANADGCVFIGANADAWFPRDVTVSSNDYPTPANQFLALPIAGASYPVHFTDQNYAGNGLGNSGTDYPAAGDIVAGSGQVTGLNGVKIPDGFIPELNFDTRYAMVALELRARPEGAGLTETGELAAFNFRSCPIKELLPNDNSMGEVLAYNEANIARTRVTAKNWAPGKWLSTVAVPNSGTAFGQWFPVNAAVPALRQVQRPQAYIMGKGLVPGEPIEFEARYVYAIYGATSYRMATGANSDVSVDASRASPVVANGFKLIEPRLSSEGRANPAGVAAVVKAEQADGRMPSVGQVISGLKVANDVITSVSGVDIAAEIAEVVGGIAAMLL